MDELNKESICEIRYRLDSLEGYINLKPENAIDEKKDFAYRWYAGALHSKGFYLHMLGYQEESEKVFNQVIPCTRKALNYCNHHIRESETQNLLFERALLFGSPEQAIESAKIISSMGITEALLSHYYLILANLFIENISEVEKLLPELQKLENKKYLTQIKLGTVRAVEALCARDINEFGAALSGVIDKHIHQIRYLREAMSLENLVSFPSVLLCIIALKFDIEAKPLVSNSIYSAKTRPLDALHRSDVSPKQRFLLPLDLIPGLYLDRWY